MNDTIENFLKALKKIDERDYTTQRVQLIEDNINVYNDVFSTYENNFVTKLNENYAVLVNQDEIKEPKELIRQFQIPKKYAYSPIAEDVITNSFNKLSDIIDDNVDSIREFTLIPDFIIHKSERNKSKKKSETNC